MTEPWRRYQGASSQSSDRPWERYSAGGGDRPWERRRNSYAPHREGDALFSGLADMLSMGRGDELMGVFGGEDAVQASRDRQAELRALHPGWFMGGQVAGGLAGGVGAGIAGRLGLRGMGATSAAANLANRVGPIGRVGAGTVVGALGGGVYGYNSGVDGARLQSAAEQLIPGAIGGGAGQLLGEVGGAALRVAGRSSGPESAAASMISNAQRRFGQVGGSLERDLANAPDGALLMDVIPGGPQLMQGASSRMSAALPEVDALLRDRNQRMAQDTVDDIWSRLNGSARQSGSATIQALRQSRRTQTRPLYDAAMARRVDPEIARRRLGSIVERNPILFQKAQDDIKEIFVSERIDPTDVSNPRYWHALQKGADRAYERLRSTPGGLASEQRRTYARALHQYRLQLRRLLGPDFAKAQNIWSGSTRAEAAVVRGFEAVKVNANDLELGELAQEMRLMTPGELEHMRIGALTKMADMIENAQLTSGRANPVRALLRSEGQRRVLRQLFGSQAQLDDVIRRIEQKQELFDNSVVAGIGVNSHTANRMAARESQMAQTNPFRGGGLWDRVENMVIGGAADSWDEAVSNQLLRELSTPAPDALRAIQNAGGVRSWARGRGLLAAAQRQALDQADFRRNALANAITGNLFWGVGGAQTSGGF